MFKNTTITTSKVLTPKTATPIATSKALTPKAATPIATSKTNTPIATSKALTPKAATPIATSKTNTLTPKTTKTIIKKIIKSTPQSIQLETFVKSLGVSEKAELYICNNLVYINANIVLPVLSVDINWFVKNADLLTHYIRIGKTIYINKYGMTKLLGQSKESVSFRLQDYLYDLFYTVETKGKVEKRDLTSRTELVNALKLAAKTTEELLLYQGIDEDNKKIIQDTTEEYNIIRCDNALLTRENNYLKTQYERTEEDLKQIEEDYEYVKQIAQTLARYVKVKSNRPPTVAYDDILENEEVDGDELTSELTLEAIKAKNNLKKYKKTTKRKNVDINDTTSVIPSKPVSLNKLFCLMRSSFPIVGTDIYKWDLTNTTVTDEFKENSKSFLLDEDETIFESPVLAIWYCDLNITLEKSKAILLFLSLADGYDERTIVKLLM